MPKRNKSIGSQMIGKLSQKERNLKVKKEMIERGERDEPTGRHPNQHTNGI